MEGRRSEGRGGWKMVRRGKKEARMNGSESREDGGGRGVGGGEKGTQGRGSMVGNERETGTMSKVECMGEGGEAWMGRTY